MKNVLMAGLAASLFACAQSSIAAPATPIVSAGRTFTCVLRDDISARPGFASCVVDQDVPGEDQKIVVIQKGWRLNGVIAESGNKIFWKAVQTGDQTGALIYERQQSMTTVFSRTPRAGDVLTVSVSRDIDFPRQ